MASRRLNTTTMTDRKSTRLNSSHVKTSYAVFCLKKKSTSLLLIAAVPPLAIGFGLPKIRSTAMIMNVCIFGAVALGPTLGGIQASAHGWRPLFWVIAAISLAALVLSVLTFEDSPPADRDAPRAPLAVGLAAAGCVAAFYGASELLTHPFLDAQTFVPLVGGLALIVILIVSQYRSKRPLLTI